MKRWFTFGALLAISSLVACGTFLSDPEQEKNFIEVLAESGFTPEQIQVIIEAIRGNLPSSEWWEEALWALGGIIGSLFGVRIWRGGIESRKGSVPTS